MANAKKTSFTSWIHFFFKDLQHVKTVVSGTLRDFVASPHRERQLHIAGFLVFFLSYFVLPDYPVDSPSSAVFLLAVLLARSEFVVLAPFILGVTSLSAGPGSR